MTIPRLLMALLAAALIIGGAFVFCAWTEKKLVAEARQGLRQAREAGNLPAELENVDLETMPLDDVGIRVSQSTMRMVSLANLLSQFAVILIPLVIIASIVTAWLLGRTG